MTISLRRPHLVPLPELVRAPRTPTRAPEPARILALQRSAGNRAVAQLMRKETQFGLRSKAELAGYAGLAADYWRANPDKTLEEYGEHLMAKLNEQLAVTGVVPIVKVTFKPTSHRAGGFRRGAWSVELDAAQIAQHPLTTKVGTIPLDRIAEVTSICLHEARHCEQVWYEARAVAAEGGKDAKAIADELKIPPKIAQAAIDSKARMPDKAGMAQVEQWRAFAPGGRHDDYWTFNEAFREDVATVVDGLPKPEPDTFAKVAAAAATLFPKLQTWRGAPFTFVDTKRGALAKVKAPDAADKLVDHHLVKIRSQITRIIKAHEALKALIANHQANLSKPGYKPPSGLDAELVDIDFAGRWLELKIAILDLRDATVAAYREYPNEADSYAAQAEVDKAFRAQAAKAKPGKVPATKAPVAPR